MAKKKSRRIKYATYKTLFRDCKAYDYDNETKTIIVDFPAEYLESKEYTPDGWFKSKCGNAYRKWNDEPLHSEKHLSAEIFFYTRDGVKFYCALVSGRRIFKSLDYCLNFQKAVDFCETLLNAQNAP